MNHKNKTVDQAAADELLTIAADATYKIRFLNTRKVRAIGMSVFLETGLRRTLA